MGAIIPYSAWLPHTCSLIACGCAILLLRRAASASRANAWLFAFPVACLMLIGLSFLAYDHNQISLRPIKQLSHILISVTTCGLLGLACIQAILLACKHYGLRHQKSASWLLRLPSLEGLEIIFFYTLSLSFGLLSIALATGLIYPVKQAVSRQYHYKAYLSLLAWACLAILLFGHYRAGWRGRTIWRWLSLGVALLIASYLSTKELIHG